MAQEILVPKKHEYQVMTKDEIDVLRKDIQLVKSEDAKREYKVLDATLASLRGQEEKAARRLLYLGDLIALYEEELAK